MALFGRKSLADFSLEELEAEIEKRKQAEPKAEDEVVEGQKTEEPKADEPAPENVDNGETAEPMVEEEVKEEPVSEEVVEPAVDENNDAVENAKFDELANTIQSLNAKVESSLEEFRAYKEKVDALLEKVGEAEKPAESVGLEKSKKVEDAKGDDELSAHEYAKKYAKY